MNNKKTVNFYEVLGINREATFKEIKMAYMLKVETITSAFESGQLVNYTPEDLKLVNKAFITLSSPIKRYIHDCEIDDEEPSFETNGEDYYEDAYKGDNDLSRAEDETMIRWLNSKISFYYRISQDYRYYRFYFYSTIDDFNEIIDDMVLISVRLQEELKLKEQSPQRKLEI